MMLLLDFFMDLLMGLGTFYVLLLSIQYINGFFDIFLDL